MPKKRPPTVATVAADLEDFKGEARDRLERLEAADARLLKCMDEMKESQAQAATKADLTRTETLILGALDRAFKSMRTRHIVIGGAVVALLVIAGAAATVM